MILFGLHRELKVRNKKMDSRRHNKVPVRKDVINIGMIWRKKRNFVSRFGAGVTP